MSPMRDEKGKNEKKSSRSEKSAQENRDVRTNIGSNFDYNIFFKLESQWVLIEVRVVGSFTHPY